MMFGPPENLETNTALEWVLVGLVVYAVVMGILGLLLYRLDRVSSRRSASSSTSSTTQPTGRQESLATRAK